MNKQELIKTYQIRELILNEKLEMYFREKLEINREILRLMNGAD